MIPLRAVVTFVFCCACVCLAQATPKAGELTPMGAGGAFAPVTVSDDAGVARQGELVRGGVPFARGAVKSVGQIRVADDAGGVIPCQVKQLAWWDDRSVKWARVSFRADVAKGGRRGFRVVVLPSAGPKPPDGVRVARRGPIVTLDTGQLRASFNTRAFRLFESVATRAGKGPWRRVTEAVDDGLYMGVIRRKAPRVGKHWFAPAGAGDKLRFTARGPAKFSIEERGPLFTTLRFAGWFRLDGKAQGERCGQFILRVTAFAGSRELELKHTFIYTGEPTRDFTNALGLRLTFAPGATAALLDGATQVRQDLGAPLVAIQDSCDTLSVNGVRARARPTGAVALLGDGASVTATVRDSWRHFPKGMTATRNGLDIALWPEGCGRVLDLRRTGGDHEPGIGAADRESSAQGLGKTHEVLLVFGDGVSGEELRRRALAFNRPLVPAAAPAYLCGTFVEGHVLPMDFERFPRTETFADLAWRWLRGAQDKFKWYGFCNYGDFRTDYRRRQKRWLDTGRYGWRHAAGDIPAGLGLTYLRLGDRDLLDLFLAEANHIRDVDTVHYKGKGQPHPLGTMHRRNKDHWSGVATPHYTYTRGLALAYFLTGDPRTLEVLRETAQPHGDPNMITAFARCYEATGEKKYLAGLKQRIKIFIGNPPRQPYHNFRFTTDYFRALAQYARVCPEDKVARDTIVRQADWWTHPDRWNRHRYGFGFYYLYARALAYWRNPDRDKYITYSAYALASIMYNGPTKGYRGAPFEKLDALVSKHGVNLYASLSAGWFLDFYPYGLAAVAHCGMTQKDILDTTKYTANLKGGRLYQTQTTTEALAKNKGFTCVRLPMTNWPGDRPLRVSDPKGKYRFAPGFDALPWGARLTLGGVPFRLASRKRGFVVLKRGAVKIPVGRACDRLHILGNVATKANWKRDELGATYRVTFADGTTLLRPMRNLADYEDVTMWKFSPGSTLARYVSHGYPLPRTHLNIVTLDTKGRKVVSLELLPGDVDDGLCLVAVTAETGAAPKTAGTLYTFGAASGKGAVKVGVARYTPKRGYGWTARCAPSRLGANIGRGAAFLVDGLKPGAYRVTVAMRTHRARAGGLMDILANGRRLQGAAIASNTNDEISFVTQCGDGRLRTGFYPNPRDIGGVWFVERLRIEPTKDASRVESFQDTIADLRPLRSLSFGATASCEQGWFAGYTFHHPKVAIDGRFSTAFGMPKGVDKAQLVLTLKKPVTANAARLLVGKQLDTALTRFDLALEGWRDGRWVLISRKPERVEQFDFVYRFAPFTSSRFRLNITDRRKNIARLRSRLIREFQLFDTRGK